MQGHLSEIDRTYPVRNSTEQKELFRSFVKAMFPESRTEKLQEHTNIILGDPEQAEVIFTAHYDTPRRSLFPNLMLPVSPLPRTAYLILIMLPLFAVIAVFIWLINTVPDTIWGIPSRVLLLTCYFIVYSGLFMLLFKGPANKHNRNDNTSGTAAVLELASLCGTNSGCAFILFDNEEKGKLGSKAYARTHEKVKTSVPVINLDCVGLGGTFVLSASDPFLSSPLCARIRDAAEKSGTELLIRDRKHSSMNSDHLRFDISAGICACKKSKKGLLYTPYIHTKRDTQADEHNLEQLTGLLSEAVK